MSKTQNRSAVAASGHYAESGTVSSPSLTGQTESTVDWHPVASLLKVRERAFWKLVHEHGLPHFRINARVIRFRMSDVENWLADHRKGAL
jgi:excisionase family DNA binding protein